MTRKLAQKHLSPKAFPGGKTPAARRLWRKQRAEWNKKTEFVVYQGDALPFIHLELEDPVKMEGASAVGRLPSSFDGQKIKVIGILVPKKKRRNKA